MIVQQPTTSNTPSIHIQWDTMLKDEGSK